VTVAPGASHYSWGFPETPPENRANGASLTFFMRCLMAGEEGPLSYPAQETKLHQKWDEIKQIIKFVFYSARKNGKTENTPTSSSPDHDSG